MEKGKDIVIEAEAVEAEAAEAEVVEAEVVEDTDTEAVEAPPKSKFAAAGLAVRRQHKAMKQQMALEALKKTFGNAYEAAKLCGISSSRIRNWAYTDPAFKAAMEETKECLIDMAETALAKKIREGDVKAITFYLRTVGRQRGYIERIPLVWQGDPNDDSIKKLCEAFFTDKKATKDDEQNSNS